MSRRTVATIAAWLGLGVFVAATLGYLSFALLRLWPGGEGVMPPEMQGLEGPMVFAWGLSYHHAGGLWLALGESLVVVLATLGAARGEGVLARLGLLALVAWAGLWLVGTGRLLWIIGDWGAWGPWLVLALIGLASAGSLLVLSRPDDPSSP